jgi:hypothetical protein
MGLLHKGSIHSSVVPSRDHRIIQAKHTQPPEVFGTFIHRIVKPKVAELSILTLLRYHEKSYVNSTMGSI